MAHLVKLCYPCARCKTKRATVRVFNSANASLGDYCTTCGARRLVEIQRSERELDAGAKP